MTLHDITRQQDFLNGFADIVRRIGQAADSIEVTALLAQATQQAGADVAAFASFMQDDEFYESYRFILTCDPCWCLAYESGAYYMHDPWLFYARHHTEPVVANRLEATTAKAQEIRALAHHYGFVSALIVPAQAPHGLTRLGALCLGSKQPDFFNDDGLSALTIVATRLAISLHEWQITQLRNELMRQAALSPEDVTLLMHQRQGRKSKEIARVTNTTPMAVDSQWQRLNAKLGVNTRLAAVRRAAEYGLI